MTPAVRVAGLSKAFGGENAVDGLSFEAMPGELFGLVGPDGAGKTTTLRMLAGVLRPTSGDAEVFGVSVVRDPEGVKTEIAYMSQRFGLYADLTVLENLSFYADLYRGAAGGAAGAARAALPLLEPGAVLRPARGQALRRHEAEARALLRPHPPAPAPAPRRAHLRRRPDLAPRPVAHRARDGRARQSPRSSAPPTWTRPSASTGWPAPPGTGPRLGDARGSSARRSRARSWIVWATPRREARAVLQRHPCRPARGDLRRPAARERSIRGPRPVGAGGRAARSGLAVREIAADRSHARGRLHRARSQKAEAA